MKTHGLSGRFELPRLRAWACSVVLVACGAAGLPAKGADNRPQLVQFPQLNAATLLADDTTLYTVSVTVQDANGYNDLVDVRVLFRYNEAQSDPSLARGCLGWAINDSYLSRWGATWVTANATGGGRWGYQPENWGGTTYITPVGCTTTVSGTPSGATGYRTVTWTFKVKPAWAGNPLVNDADVWFSDTTTNIGWFDNPASFDVVEPPCHPPTATPRAPLVAVAGPTSIDVTLDPADSVTDLFLIEVTPPSAGRSWLQADGTLGFWPLARTRTQWGTTRLTGLLEGTSYTLRARAVGPGGACPSGFGPATTVTAAMVWRTIPGMSAGMPVSRGLLGLTTRPDDPSYPAIWAKIWEIAGNTLIRGVAGGLDADTYNWKDMSGQGVGHTGTPEPEIPTTLTWLRLARDHGSEPMITVNCRGIGLPQESGYCRFRYTDTSIETMSALAADWVRYVNHILPTRRQGQSLPPAEQALLDSISWYERPKLLEPGEASTPRVIWWEIGNEPELGLPGCTAGAPIFRPDPATFAQRYRQITAAMRAVDPTIKVGPCHVASSNGTDWQRAVLNDPAAVVDFVSYHPYGPLYWFGMIGFGDTVAAAESALGYIKTLNQSLHAGVINDIVASGRNPAQIKLFASEYNPGDWKWEIAPQIRRQAHALGLAETLFTLTELGVFGANFWSYPCWYPDGTETPGYKVFKMLQTHFCDELIDSYSDGRSFRMYTLRDTETGKLDIWGLNFSETSDKTVRLSIQLPDQVIQSVQLLRLENLSGDTSLFDTNDPPASAPPRIDWTVQSLSNVDLMNLPIVFEDATITVVHIEYRPAARPDFDLDGDVDMDDFGRFQRCMSGQAVPQPAPECARARLDADSDVDRDDFILFRGCLSGADVPALPSCLP